MAVERTLANRRILLVIGGGIAAYKALDLVRRLRERGGVVRAVMTEASKAFVTPLSVASLTGERIYDNLFSLTDEAEMGHIELSRAADLVVVAPATANLMAKMAQGLADDLASTLLLATDKRVLIAPSMNVRMWLHPSTQRNYTRLMADGVLAVGPEEGVMACGEYGPGRMAEPLEIVGAIEAALAAGTVIPLPNITGRAPSVPTPQLLAGRRVVVTSGPTHEPLDPVRFLANRSSGRQGHAIAVAAASAGAEVVLISGPVALPDPAGLQVVHVETARDMMAAVQAAIPADIVVAAAAVADWRPVVEAGHKIKKQPGDPAPVLRLEENPDILATISRPGLGRPRLVVGFAAETDHLLAHARSKLDRKGCDVIVANDVGHGTGILGGTMNEVSLVTRTGTEAWPRLDKAEVARRLVERLARMLQENPS